MPKDFPIKTYRTDRFPYQNIWDWWTKTFPRHPSNSVSGHSNWYF